MKCTVSKLQKVFDMVCGRMKAGLQVSELWQFYIEESFFRSISRVYTIRRTFGNDAANPEADAPIQLLAGHTSLGELAAVLESSDSSP